VHEVESLVNDLDSLPLEDGISSLFRNIGK